MGYTNPSEQVMIFFYLHQSVIFENLMKKLDSGWHS